MKVVEDRIVDAQFSHTFVILDIIEVFNRGGTPMTSAQLEYLQEQLAELKERVSLLEDHKKMLLSLITSERHPFTYHMLEAGASQKQVDAVFDLMDEAQRRIQADTPPNHGEFERKVYEIFPSHKGDYHFAEGVVSTLRRSGQYAEVFEYYSRNGMNLPPIED